MKNIHTNTHICSPYQKCSQDVKLMLLKQDGQCMYNITLWSVHITTLQWKHNNTFYVLLLLSYMLLSTV